MDQGLLHSLRELREAVDLAVRTQWDRSLPFTDAVFDRWERATNLGFGDGASIYDSASVFGDVAVGPGTWIGPGVLLDGSGAPLRIGAGCDVSAGVQIYTHDTVLRCISGRVVDSASAAVDIGDNTYIGPQAMIVAGVSIGSHSVVGANSLVKADVDDRTVVAGSPARIIGTVVGEGAETRIEAVGQP
jgi:acetyltransferase-like isoleucine patch superfamily enzyme